MLVVTNLHSTVAIACYAAIAAVWFAWRRQWQRFVTVVVCVGGGLELNVLMKHAFHRPRPAFDDPLLTLSTYSFPSGHVAASTIFYGLVVVAQWEAKPGQADAVVAILHRFCRRRRATPA